MTEVKSSLAATTQLPVARYNLSHPLVAIDFIFAASAAGSGSHGDDGMIELRDMDEDHRGWSGDSRREMTSWKTPLFLTPAAFIDAEWQLRHIDLRKILSTFLYVARKFIDD